MSPFRWTTFMQWVGYAPIKETFFEAHVLCNDAFRNSYRRVVNDVLAYARRERLTHIVELGAGTAPLTEAIAARDDARDLRLSPCDAAPETHRARYQQLAKRNPAQVTPVLEPVDFTFPRAWGAGSLLILLGTFPALPEKSRQAALRALTQSSDRVMVWEFVRRSPLSALLAACTFFTALLVPLYFVRSAGRLRRGLWCWLVPVVPLMCAADGVAWSLRCWTDDDWRRELAAILPPTRKAEVRSWTNSQLVTW